jgi:hypothetical protein
MENSNMVIMVMVCNFEVISKKFSGDRICTYVISSSQNEDDDDDRDNNL